VAGTKGQSFVGVWRWMRPLQAGGSPASGPGGFYVVVVIVALLFCHGAFGYAHQLPPADASAAHVAHVEGGHQPDPDGGADGSHLGGTYFATLLVLLFGTSLLLGGGVSVGALRAPTPWTGGHKVRRLHPPRGPTSSYLQVFRL
jgi:H+/Cl- antiporter ClcA